MMAMGIGQTNLEALAHHTQVSDLVSVWVGVNLTAVWLRIRCFATCLMCDNIGK